MIIYAGLSLRSRQAPPWRWAAGLDSDFVQYLLWGLRRAVAERLSIDIHIISGLRTYAQQAQLYAANPGKAARPGLSQHEYGYAVDLTVTLPPQTAFRLPEIVGASPEDVAPRGLAQTVLKHVFSELYFLKEDPGHVAYYSAAEWHQALAEAGYLGGGDVSPIQPWSLEPVVDPNFVAGAWVPAGLGW